jgi:solute:Na+ symporter, SSS family
MLLDKILVAGYFGLLICVAVYYKLKSKKVPRVSGPSLDSNLTLAIAMFLNSVGGGTIFGLGEKTFEGDLTIAFGLMLAIVSDILFGIFITPKIATKRSFKSIGNMMEEYYGISGRVFTGICATTVSLGYVAIQINVSTKIFANILGVNSGIGAVISYCVVVIYTLIGGLRSTLKTNVVQFTSLMLAIPLISLLSIKKAGAYKIFFTLTNAKLDMSPVALLFLVLGFSCMSLDPALIKRNLIASTAQITTSAMLIKSFLYAMCLLLLTLNALAAKELFPSIEPTSVIPTLINNILPFGISGIVIVGFFAAIMSTADASLQIAVESVKQDILIPLNIAKNKNTRLLSLVAKILVVTLGSGSIFMSLKFEYAIDLAFFVAGTWFPIIIIPLAAALYKVHISTLGFFISSAVSFLSFIISEMLILPFGLKSVFVASIISCLMFCLIKLIEKQFYTFKNKLS